MTWTLPLKRRRQETEQVCSESNLLHGILQISTAAIVILDRQGNVCFATDRTKQVLGCTPLELTQQPFQSAIWNITDLAGNPYSDSQHPFQQIIQAGEPVVEAEYAVQIPEGEQRYISVNGVPLKDDAGKITGAVLSILNISSSSSSNHLIQNNCQLKVQEPLVDLIAQHIRRSLNLKTILQTTVNEVQRWLQADRVIIYQLESATGGGAVVVEACDPAFSSLLGWRIRDTASPQNCFFLKEGSTKIQAIEDIFQSSLDSTCVQLLEAFAVKSQLVIPIFQSTYPAAGDCATSAQQQTAKGRLWGMLIVHQCSDVRPWQQSEIELLQRLEIQLAVAIQHAELYQKLENLNAELEAQVQQRTMQLRKTLDYEAVLRRITDRLRDTLDERVILQTAVRELAQALNLQSCHASFYNLQDQTATVLYEYVGLSDQSSVGNVSQIDDFPEIYQPILQQRSLQLCSVSTTLLQQQTSVLICPIADKRGVLGDLCLLHSRNYVFDEQEVQLAQQVATQCTIAIRQARLYKTAQAQVKELEKLNRLKDDFLSTISHELRTPLANMKMSIQLLDLLIKQIFPEAELEELNINLSPQLTSISALYSKLNQCLCILQEECDRETTLINDLLTLQQVEAGTQPLSPGPIYLQDWIPQVVESFQAADLDHQQHLTTEVLPDLPPLISDLFVLNRILVELLTNASKFTPAGGSIIVKGRHLRATDRSIARIQIQVINTGITIAAEQLPLIFDQFYRIPSDDPWKHGGTGLGLTLVKKMVNYLEGVISVKSEAGQTEFTIELPCGIGVGRTHEWQ